MEEINYKREGCKKERIIRENVVKKRGRRSLEGKKKARMEGGRNKL